MKKKEIYEKAKAAELRTYKKIQAWVLVCGLLSFFISWRIGLVGCAWFIWNDIVFELGNREHSPVEYETGYVNRGLNFMFKSWLLYALFAATLLWLTFSFSLPLYQW